MSTQRIPGMAVAVVRNGKVVKAQGYGLANVEHNVPVTADDLPVRIGRQAVHRHRRDAAGAGWPALARRSDREVLSGRPHIVADITVRHLLTHTSGIPEYTDGQLDYRKDYSEDELVRLPFELPLDSCPATSGSTATPATSCSARSCEGAGSVLRRRVSGCVFAPLGMKTARIISEADIVPNRAAGYRFVKGELRNQEWVPPALEHHRGRLPVLVVAGPDRVGSRHSRRRGVTAGELAPDLHTGRSSTVAGCTRTGSAFKSIGSAGQDIQRHGGSWQGFQTYIARYLGDDVTVIALANLAQASPGASSIALPPTTCPRYVEQQLDDPRRAGRRRHRRAAAARRRAHRGRHHREVGARHAAPGRSRRRRHGAGARAGLHRRAQPLHRGPRQPSRTRSRRCRRASRPLLVGPGRQLAVAAARLSGQAARPSRRGERRACSSATPPSAGR